MEISLYWQFPFGTEYGYCYFEFRTIPSTLRSTKHSFPHGPKWQFLEQIFIHTIIQYHIGHIAHSWWYFIACHSPFSHIDVVGLLYLHLPFPLSNLPSRTNRVVPLFSVHSLSHQPQNIYDVSFLDIFVSFLEILLRPYWDISLTGFNLPMTISLFHIWLRSIFSFLIRVSYSFCW